MSIIQRILCLIGIHQGEWTIEGSQQRRFCIFCGKSQNREVHKTLATKQHKARRSSINHKTLARRDELAREHQLGNLELQRTFMSPKVWFISTGTILALSYAFWYVVFQQSGEPFILALQFSIPYLIIWTLVGIGFICLPFILNEDVYIYTNGLVYLGLWSSGAARWEKIREVVLRPGNEERSPKLDVSLYGGTRIRLPVTWVSKGSTDIDTIKKFIEEKRAQTRRVSDQ